MVGRRNVGLLSPSEWRRQAQGLSPMRPWAMASCSVLLYYYTLILYYYIYVLPCIFKVHRAFLKCTVHFKTAYSRGPLWVVPFPTSQHLPYIQIVYETHE